MERVVISGDKQGLEAWAQVFIVRKGIVSWSWPVSLLVTGAMGVYIASLILRDHSVGLQYMKIIRYDSMVSLMKDVSSDLWDGVLCLLQGSCAFVLDTTTCLVTENSDIHILGVSSGRHSKGSNMICDYPLTSKISVSYFHHFDIGGVTKCACVLVHNIPLLGSVQ